MKPDIIIRQLKYCIEFIGHILTSVDSTVTVSAFVLNTLLARPCMLRERQFFLQLAFLTVDIILNILVEKL